MKKIFAIALALVMVLSMASAFAAATMPGTCSFGSWDCTTYTSKCGVAKAEVVLFVKGNNCYETYTESNCAGVVKGEHVFYGVKVTFDKDVNEQWFNHVNTKLVITYKDLNATYGAGAAAKTFNGNFGFEFLSNMGKGYADVKKGGVFWVKFARNGNPTTLVSADDFDDDCVDDAWATSLNAKVCANVAYEFNGNSANLIDINNNPIAGGWIDFGQYSVWNNGAGSFIVKDNATGDQATFNTVNGKLNNIVIGGQSYGAYKDGKLYGWDANANQYVTEGTTCSFLPDMLKFLGISDLGTCMTGDAIKAHFGWDDDGAFKSCKTWSKNAVVAVDPECKVEIPKTGDVSVVAYAVMALVAAAGAMGLKK